MPRVPPVTIATLDMCIPYLSTHMAIPMPPPMHSVAMPFFACRFCISCKSVTRMPARDRAAIYVHPGRIPAKILVDGYGLRGKGFVGFDQVEIGDFPAGFFQ